MNYEKEIPFGAFNSELMHQEINIPEGFEANIEGDKIILKKIESDDERIRKYLIRYIDNTMRSSTLKSKLLAWLEKQGEQKTDKDMIEALRTEYEKGRHNVIEKAMVWLTSHMKWGVVSWDDKEECVRSFKEAMKE